LLLLHPKHAFGFFSTPPSLPVTLPPALTFPPSRPSSSDNLDLRWGGNEDDDGGADAGGLGRGMGMGMGAEADGVRLGVWCGLSDWMRWDGRGWRMMEDDEEEEDWALMAGRWTGVGTDMRWWWFAAALGCWFRKASCALGGSWPPLPR